jgi:hypothetical protein
VVRAVGVEQASSSSSSSSNQETAVAAAPANSQLTVYFREEDVTVVATPGEDLVEVRRDQCVEVSHAVGCAVLQGWCSSSMHAHC